MPDHGCFAVHGNNKTGSKNLVKLTTMYRNPENLPHALSNFDQILDIIDNKNLLLILDYDGTLSPIVSDPKNAVMPSKIKALLERLSTVAQVAVISGRDRLDVEERVGLRQLIYAGSHGLDMAGPEGLEIPEKISGEVLEALKEATDNLSKKLADVKGSLVEFKKYAIAVHFRNVADDEVELVKKAVSEELDLHKSLKKGTGKKILELKPAIDWHKGRAIDWLFEALGMVREDALPLFVGDDITDEDGFESIAGYGIGVLVGTHGQKTAASYALKDTEEVGTFLEKIYKEITSQHGR